MKGWIQSADLSVKQMGSLELERALALFRDSDWDGELVRQAELERAGADSCPPGLGIVNDFGPFIIHLCPLPDDRLLVHYHFQARSGLAKWLGHQRTHTVEDAPRDAVKGILGRFYLSDHDELMSELERLGRSATAGGAPRE